MTKSGNENIFKREGFRLWISDLLEKICDLKFELQLAYLVDIFEHLNNLNLQLQGSGHKNLGI